MNHVYNLLDTCRLCLEHGTELFSVFDDVDFENIIEKISSCLLVEILRTDKVSKVCRKCVTAVNEFHAFRLHVSSSQEKLTLLLADYERETFLAELDLAEMGGSSRLQDCNQEKGRPILIDPCSPEDFLNSLDTSIAENTYIGYSQRRPAEEDKLENPLDLSCCNIFKPDLANPSSLLGSPSKPKDKHTCQDCKKSFSSLRSLVKHLTKCHWKNNPLSCSTCHLSFATQDALKAHSLTHKQKYFCDKCLYSSFSLSNFKIHMMKHNTEYLIECEHCGKGFYRKQTYLDHKMREHSNTSMNYKCETCGKMFQSKPNLEKHKKTHNPDQKKYQCELCGRVFITWKGIQRHMGTIHLGYRYTCDVCDKQVTSLQSLKQHKKTHTGEKEFVCDECGKSFLKLSSLIVHRRTHTGEKPYSCNVCQKKFSQKSSLNVHTRCHTGEKPYSCSVCQKRFTTKTILNTHVKSQHDSAL